MASTGTRISVYFCMPDMIARVMGGRAGCAGGASARFFCISFKSRSNPGRVRGKEFLNQMPWVLQAFTGLQLLQLFSQVDQVDSQVTARAVVVGVCVPGIQVDQSCDSFGMPGSHRTQLFAAERVPGQNRPVQLECSEDGENVATETIGRIHRVPGRSAGRAEAAPCDAVNM